MLDLVVNRPIDVPTRETVKFLVSHIAECATILEVGCGDGQVARELVNRGYRVTGLDSDPDAIGKARVRGIHAILGSWPEYHSNASFDAIAFTRSLHHIDPLGEAIARARELLHPNGLILLEDFAREEVDEATVTWFATLLRSERARALISPVAGQLVSDLLSATNVMRAWHESHLHKMHSIAAITKAIAEQFHVRDTRSVPYFYRYLIPVLPDTPEATSFVNEVFEQEIDLGARGEIVLLGRRIIASP